MQEDWDVMFSENLLLVHVFSSHEFFIYICFIVFFYVNGTDAEFHRIYTDILMPRYKVYTNSPQDTKKTAVLSRNPSFFYKSTNMILEENAEGLTSIFYFVLFFIFLGR